VKLRWTHNALEHLIAIHEHIAHDAPVYALRMVDRITARSQQIASFPESGRMVPEYALPTVREVIEPPYRIIYRIGQDQIDVLAVIHSARLMPPDL
jgi:plasmid stabilization system protein ParE